MILERLQEDFYQDRNEQKDQYDTLIRYKHDDVIVSLNLFSLHYSAPQLSIFFYFLLPVTKATTQMLIWN